MPRIKKSQAASSYSHHKTKKTATRHAKQLRNKNYRARIKKEPFGYGVFSYKK